MTNLTEVSIPFASGLTLQIREKRNDEEFIVSIPFASGLTLLHADQEGTTIPDSKSQSPSHRG